MAVSFKGPIFHRTSCSWASADTWRIPLEARAMAKRMLERGVQVDRAARQPLGGHV